MNSKLIKKNLENERNLWWLRSASSDYSDFVGDVDNDGYVDYNDGYVDYYDVGDDYGCSTICLII